MQIVGEQHVRVVPDVAVSNGSGGMADGLMALLLRSQLNGGPAKVRSAETDA